MINMIMVFIRKLIGPSEIGYEVTDIIIGISYIGRHVISVVIIYSVGNLSRYTYGAG